ncbi:MAG: hypothetical protein Q4C60_05830, partial [Eubacteriales bacterium]|nr:hypothetical protein [Eubacteriales bacterium]
MKKFIAMVLAASVVCALPVSAAQSPTAPVVSQQTQEAQSAEETAVQAQAQAAGMTVQEYRNNVVTSTEGVSGSVQVQIGQGGHVVINGAPSNLTIPLSKPTTAAVTFAQTNAAAATASLAQAIPAGAVTVTNDGQAQVVETSRL